MRDRFVPFGTSAFFGGPAVAAAPVVHIIDDLGESLKFVAGALEKSGYVVIISTSLREFADGFNPARTRAVFLDVHLGTEDATDIIDFLKNKGAKTEVFLVSGDLRSIDAAKSYAEERGVKIFGTIQKPFTGSRLLEMIEPRVDSLDSIVSDLSIAEGFAKGWIYPVLQPKLDLQSGRTLSAVSGVSTDGTKSA